MVVAQPEMTIEEFERFAKSPENAHRRLEMVDGVIVEKEMPTQEHGFIGANLSFFFSAYTRQTGIGRVYIEARYKTPTDRRNSRIPDISVSLSKAPIVTEGSAPILPDIAIEIKSPGDTLYDLRHRIAYYLANGTRVGIVVLPRQRIIEVMRVDAADILNEDDTLTLEDILPKFSLAIKDIFADTQTTNQ